jgi:hypothetical protein
MDSDTFRGIGTAAVVLHVLLWLFVSGATVWGSCTGRLFHAPGLETPGRLQEAAAAAAAADPGYMKPGLTPALPDSLLGVPVAGATAYGGAAVVEAPPLAPEPGAGMLSPSTSSTSSRRRRLHASSTAQQGQQLALQVGRPALPSNWLTQMHSSSRSGDVTCEDTWLERCCEVEQQLDSAGAAAPRGGGFNSRAGDVESALG